MNNYSKLTGKCVNCAGCNRLENTYFTGRNECEYYLHLLPTMPPKAQAAFEKIHTILNKDKYEQMKL